jgi:branched-chain amino acid transport system permease protein
VFLAVFAFGAGMAGMAGIVGGTFSRCRRAGHPLPLASLVVVIVGGMGSIPGPRSAPSSSAWPSRSACYAPTYSVVFTS